MAVASASKQKQGEPAPIPGKAGAMTSFSQGGQRVPAGAGPQGEPVPELSIPNIADYLPPEARRWGRIFFATLGIALSVLGMIGTIVAYVLLSSAVTNSEKLMLSQIDGVDSALFDLETSVEGLASAGGDAANSTQSLATALRGFSAASGGISGSLEGIANSLSGVAIGGMDAQAAELREQAVVLREVSGNFSGSAASAESMGEKIGESFGGLRELKQDIAQIGANLGSAREGVKSAFGTVSLAILVGAFVLLLLFAALGCACMAALL